MVQIEQVKSVLLEILGEQEFSHITSEEHQRLKLWPNRLMCPMLTENVCRIRSPSHVEELNESSRNAFSSSMKGEKVVSLVQLGLRCGCPINY